MLNTGRNEVDGSSIMKNNKYLKELGLTWYDLPGNYVSKLKRRKLKKYKESWAFDERNKENRQGFCEYEFFSLDYSLALYIYPRLCYFKEHYAKIATPACFCYDKNDKAIDGDVANKKWLETLDKIILAFRYIITEPDEDYKKIDKVIKEGLKLFARHYCSLWY